MRRLYAAEAYDATRSPDSHWLAAAPPLSVEARPLADPARCEVAVIGGGFTGLSAAHRLAQTHGRAVRLFEAGPIAWGASGRNGGFCCLGGSKLGHEAIARRVGVEEARRFADAQRAAIDHVAGFLDQVGVDADRHSRGELVLAHKPSRLPALRAEAAHLKSLYGVEADVMDRPALEAAGVAGPEFHAGLHIPFGFALNPLIYARALASACVQAGVVLHPHSPVTDWRMDGDRHRLSVNGLPVVADRVVLAVNGYGSEDMPEWMAGRTLPALSRILVTRPLTAAERAAQGWTSALMAQDSRRLLHYFRLLPDGRFLFGGRGGLDAGEAAAGRSQSRLRADFDRMFPAWAHVETERSWSGFVCLSASLAPFIGALPDRPGGWTALAYHGNGVAMGSWSGARVADLAAGAKGAEAAIPRLMRGPLKRFPAPRLRLAALRAAYLAYGVADRFL